MLTLNDEQASRLAPFLTPRLPTPYCNLHIEGLTVKQQAAHLLHEIYEVMYGGAGGGGKTWWLLAEALAYVDAPRYSAILLRATWPNLNREPDGLIPLSHMWLGSTAAKWDAENRTWKFPSGATLTFGHLANPSAHFGYAGPSYQFLGFDEVTEIRPGQYEFLQSRLRRLEGNPIPIRLRCASNPGGQFHDYYREHFGLDGSAIPVKRKYVPARVVDNPHLDAVDYAERLSGLPDVIRRRILDGDWAIDDTGGMFKIEHLGLTSESPSGARVCRVWDLAATEATPGHDPDWTAGVKVARLGEDWWVLDVVRLRGTPEKVEALIMGTAGLDGKACAQLIEQEPGASGKMVISYVERLLRDIKMAGRVGAVMPSGDKTTRAMQAASIVNQGQVTLVEGPWNDGFIAQLSAFPNVTHDDMTDSFAHAVNYLAPVRGKAGRSTFVGRLPEGVGG